jgi:hypothetical protein
LSILPYLKLYINRETNADLFAGRPVFALASFATASPRGKKHVNHASRVIIFIYVSL